jgi:hypothetical protein
VARSITDHACLHDGVARSITDHACLRDGMARGNTDHACTLMFVLVVGWCDTHDN